MPVPQHCPTPRELDDLELLLAGGFGAGGYRDGGPARLSVPAGVADAVTAAGAVDLVDPEGLPLARVRPASVADDGRVTGPVAPLGRPEHGPFRRLHLTPAEVRERYDGALFVPLDRVPSTRDTDRIAGRREGRRVVLLALTGVGTPHGLTPVGLLRVALAAARRLGDAAVVAVPLADHGEADPGLRARVCAAYAAGELLDEVRGDGAHAAELAEIVEQDRPAEPGVVVFFTGLSGSGKSTLARALHDRILEAGRRTVTSLDGDVVRRNLSKGLTFSKEDRETNILRIGWVAAEISRHRGIAICSPIAPFDATRKAVRQLVADAGGRFVLVHVATPLAECERRDRKGLYARARAGEIGEFTGISSPYEEPDDAEVVVDTTGRSIDDALADVLAGLPLEVDAPTLVEEVAERPSRNHEDS